MCSLYRQPEIQQVEECGLWGNNGRVQGRWVQCHVLKASLAGRRDPWTIKGREEKVHSLMFQEYTQQNRSSWKIPERKRKYKA